MQPITKNKKCILTLIIDNALYDLQYPLYSFNLCYCSKHGEMQIGTLHCLQQKLVCPLHPALLSEQTSQSGLYFMFSYLSGKCRPVIRKGSGVMLGRPFHFLVQVQCSNNLSITLCRNFCGSIASFFQKPFCK